MSTTFINPASGSSYRLRSDPPNWRIIKSRTVDDQIIVRKLAGTDADTDVPQVLLDRLVRGELAIPKATGNAHRAFSQVILMDLDRTYEWLVAIAREAETRCRQGYPGFRPNSPQLKRDAGNAANTALLACADMAAAWKGSGLEAVGVVPEWLGAALGDGE
jgi:hypothetical protein